MKLKWPTFGAYLILYNAERSAYPWRETITSALSFCDKVYVLECRSDDDTAKELESFRETLEDEKERLVINTAEKEWDMDDMAIVGNRKQEARSKVTEDWCVYLDADEILEVKNRADLVDLILHNHHLGHVFSVPYITFFGSPYTIGNFKDCENFWRWKIFRNLDAIGHGVHKNARKYDEDGCMYFDKADSDGCELINIETLDIMPSIMFMPGEYGQAGQVYTEQHPDHPITKAQIGDIFTRTMNDFPVVCYHYGWIDFEAKANNALHYWTKTKAFRTGIEHSELFDGLASKVEGEVWIDGGGCKKAKLEEWRAKPTIAVHPIQHPPVIQEHIANLTKPRILNISLDKYVEAGVPAWGRQLETALSEYEVVWYAFNGHAGNVPPEALENDKAEAFCKWIQEQGCDKDALVVFGDGFWASTYTGPARVVSVVHGLWSHPERDKWDDGLLEQRQHLFAKQLEYYKNAEELGHKLICVSPFIHEILKEEYGIDTTLIPNAIDPKPFQEAELPEGFETDKPIIMHAITSVNKGKDIREAFRDHELIKDKFHVMRLDEVEEKFQLTKAQAFKAASVIWAPTKWEASSYFLLEALAAEKPIVSYNTGILRSKKVQKTKLDLWDAGIRVVHTYDVNEFAHTVALAHMFAEKENTQGLEFLKRNKMLFSDWQAAMKQVVYEVL